MQFIFLWCFIFTKTCFSLWTGINVAHAGDSDSGNSHFWQRISLDNRNGVRVSFHDGVGTFFIAISLLCVYYSRVVEWQDEDLNPKQCVPIIYKRQKTGFFNYGVIHSWGPQTYVNQGVRNVSFSENFAYLMDDPSFSEPPPHPSAIINNRTIV